MYRQGDVLLVPVENRPWPARELPHCVVAEGEVTGHTHRVEEGARQLVTPGGQQFLVVLAASAELVHEEHGTLTLPGPAIYRVVHQREYVPGKIAPMAIPDEPELAYPVWARPAYRRLSAAARRVKDLAHAFTEEAWLERSARRALDRERLEEARRNGPLTAAERRQLQRFRRVRD